jgi:hypothetical protein
MPEDTFRRALYLSSACLSFALRTAAVHAAPPAGRDAADRMPARMLVAAATARAATKLRTPGCLGVLSDFRDAAGRPLSEVLEERGAGAGEFLASLVFVDGGDTPSCATGRAAAVANPGSIFIGVCKGTFARVQTADPGLATDVVIHEMLHALGLGENPPTSEEITRQVEKRCGR